MFNVLYCYRFDQAAKERRRSDGTRFLIPSELCGGLLVHIFLFFFPFHLFFSFFGSGR